MWLCLLLTTQQCTEGPGSCPDGRVYVPSMFLDEIKPLYYLLAIQLGCSKSRVRPSVLKAGNILNRLNSSFNGETHLKVTDLMQNPI